MHGHNNKIYINNIGISTSEKEDDFYMPIAEIYFSINANPFKYLDYIDPFSNKICAYEINETLRRHGNNKSILLKEIMNLFDIDCDAAKTILANVISRLNNHIVTNNQVKNDFPSFDDLMHLAEQCGFADQNEFNFNLMLVQYNEEMHIRTKSIKHAIEYLEEFATSGDVMVSYSHSSVQKMCEEYKCLYLEKDTQNNRWIINQELRDGSQRLHDFDTLYDAYHALPLPGTIRGYYPD